MVQSCVADIGVLNTLHFAVATGLKYGFVFVIPSYLLFRYREFSGNLFNTACKKSLWVRPGEMFEFCY